MSSLANKIGGIIYAVAFVLFTSCLRFYVVFNKDIKAIE